MEEQLVQFLLGPVTFKISKSLLMQRTKLKMAFLKKPRRNAVSSQINMYLGQWLPRPLQKVCHLPKIWESLSGRAAASFERMYN